MKKKATIVLDFIGVFSATLCLVHCLIFPILSMIPFFFFKNSWVDVFFTCIAMFVVSKIIFSNAPKTVKIILALAVLLLMGGVVLETIYNIKTPLVLVGGFGMIIGHIINYKSHSK